LRGAIAKGETVLDLDKKMYLGQGIISAYELEQRLDMIGIVLQDTLSGDSSVETTVTFKCGHRERLHVPKHRQVTNDTSSAHNFKIARAQAGPNFAQRYRNSEPVL